MHIYVHTATCYSNYQGDTWPCLPHSTMLPSYPFYAPPPPSSFSLHSDDTITAVYYKKHQLKPCKPSNPSKSHAH